MDEMRYAAMEQRLRAAEARLDALEKRMGEPGGVKAQDLIKRYPGGMNKTDAANVLGITRSTVYCMIRDGRLAENNLRRVVTQSVVDMLYGPAPKRARKPRESERALRMGADNN